MLSGIKSNIDKKNITPAANEIPPIRKFNVFFLLKNITKVPSIVERPAILDSKKAICVVVILSPVNFMH